METQAVYFSTYIVHYRRDDDPYHWSIFIEKDSDTLEGHIFDIQGTTDTYKVNSKGRASMKRSNAYAGRVCIGSILGTDKRIGEVYKLLQTIEIKHNDPDWNCQNWVKEGVAKLEAKGLLELDKEPANVERYLTAEEITEELAGQE